jgi:hypothetical protein
MLTIPRRPASAAYQYRTPFHTTHAGLVSPRRTRSERPSTATFNPQISSRNRRFQGRRIPGVPRANLTSTARGRPIELMWTIPSNNRPAVKPPTKLPWSREEHVFTNTNYVLRTIADKSHAHDKQLKTIELFRDEDQSLKDKAKRRSIITKSSMEKALQRLNFTLIPEQVNEIFHVLSARRDKNDTSSDGQKCHDTTINAATFLKNLKSCHELDSKEHHATRFGSSQYAYTTRKENNGIDKRHRFPAKKTKTPKIPKIPINPLISSTTQPHHLTSRVNPFSHYEHDGLDEDKKINARIAFKRKQLKSYRTHLTHRNVRKKPMSRTQQFMKSNIDYSKYGGNY